jgi:hypothetical protein
VATVVRRGRNIGFVQSSLCLRKSYSETTHGITTPPYPHPNRVPAPHLWIADQRSGIPAPVHPPPPPPASQNLLPVTHDTVSALRTNSTYCSSRVLNFLSWYFKNPTSPQLPKIPLATAHSMPLPKHAQLSKATNFLSQYPISPPKTCCHHTWTPPPKNLPSRTLRQTHLWVAEQRLEFPVPVLHPHVHVHVRPVSEKQVA